MKESCGVDRPDALWDKVPRWQETSGYIHIGLILWLYNLARGWDLLEYGRARYQKMGIDMPWVPGNNAGGATGYDLEQITENVGMSSSELTAMLVKAHQLLGKKDSIV
jgi:predicted aldo/keto reductase-like oxidoreductase